MDRILSKMVKIWKTFGLILRVVSLLCEACSLSEISGSHGGEYDNGCLLGSYAV
jgi:hypothetical protein